MTIIGLGNTGCNIAEKFENINNVNVLLIDANIEGEENCISIQEYNSPEEYEKNFPDISNHLSKVDNDIYFIVGGSGKISGSSLSLLKQLKDKNINIIYIRPDTDSLKNDGKLQDKVVFNVMQEYARSGLFKNCMLIDNVNVEKVAGDLPIIGFFENINNIIFNILSYIIFYQNKKPIMNNLSTIKEYCKIRTIGVLDLLNEDENLLYNLESIDYKHYYFMINENRLKTDNTLLKQIKELIQSKSKDGTDCSYAIFSTKEDINCCYIDAYSKRIQE